MKTRNLVTEWGTRWLEVFPETLDDVVVTHRIPRGHKRASPYAEPSGPSPLLVNAAYWESLNVPNVLALSPAPVNLAPLPS